MDYRNCDQHWVQPDIRQDRQWNRNHYQETSKFRGNQAVRVCPNLKSDRSFFTTNDSDWGSANMPRTHNNNYTRTWPNDNKNYNNRKFHYQNQQKGQFRPNPNYQNQNGNWRRQQFWGRRQNETGKGQNRFRFQPRSIPLSQAIKELLEVAPEFDEIFSHEEKPENCYTLTNQLPKDRLVNEAENSKNKFDQFHPKGNREITSDYGSNSGDSDVEHKESSSNGLIVGFPEVHEKHLEAEVVFENLKEGDSHESQELVKPAKSCEEERVANNNNIQEPIFIAPINQDEECVILQPVDVIEGYEIGSEVMLGLIDGLISTNENDQTETIIFVANEGDEHLAWKEDPQHENEEEQKEEAFDLELGAVEVVGNENSVELAESESNVQLEIPVLTTERDPDPSPSSPRQTRKRPRVSALKERNKLVEKFAEKYHVNRNLIQPWPSVLEKTLLVKVVRCDPQVRQNQKHFFAQEDLQRSVNENENENEVSDPSTASPPSPTPSKAASVEIEVIQLDDDSQSADLSASPQSQDATTEEEASRDTPVPEPEEDWNFVEEMATTPQSEDSMDEEEPNTNIPKPEEEWNFVQEMAITPQSEDAMNEEEPKNTPEPEEEWNIVQETITPPGNNAPDSGKIKLKIKRRRIEEPPPNANSLQFFRGLCQVCGCGCDFDSSKTYYQCNPTDLQRFTTRDLQKAKMCYTCFETFSDTEWADHDKNCLVTDDEFDQSESDGSRTNAAKPLKRKRKNYICSVCFESLSNSEEMY